MHGDLPSVSDGRCSLLATYFRARREQLCRSLGMLGGAITNKFWHLQDRLSKTNGNASSKAARGWLGRQCAAPCQTCDGDGQHT